MLQLLDNLLRRLLTTRVPSITQATQVRFQPPNADWRTYVGGLGASNALNVYLAELRENRKLRSNERVRSFENGWVREEPAPPRMDCHYLISAWSPASVTQQIEPTQDEHDLLYDVTAALMDHTPLNAARIYAGQPPAPAWPQEFQRFFASDLPTLVLPVEGFPKYAEFWGTMGQPQPWKPAVYLVVTLPVVSREPAVAGPPVTTIRADVAGDGRETLYVIGGVVRDAQGAALARAFVRVETAADQTLWRAEADAEGRFVFSGLSAGRYRLRFAAPGHPAATRDVDVPAPSGEYDLQFS